MAALCRALVVGSEAFNKQLRHSRHWWQGIGRNTHTAWVNHGSWFCRCQCGE